MDCPPSRRGKTSLGLARSRQRRHDIDHPNPLIFQDGVRPSVIGVQKVVAALFVAQFRKNTHTTDMRGCPTFSPESRSLADRPARIRSPDQHFPTSCGPLLWLCFANAVLTNATLPTRARTVRRSQIIMAAPYVRVESSGRSRRKQFSMVFLWVIL